MPKGKYPLLTQYLNYFYFFLHSFTQEIIVCTGLVQICLLPTYVPSHLDASMLQVKGAVFVLKIPQNQSILGQSWLAHPGLGTMNQVQVKPKAVSLGQFFMLDKTPGESIPAFPFWRENIWRLEFGCGSYHVSCSHMSKRQRLQSLDSALEQRPMVWLLTRHSRRNLP